MHPRSVICIYLVIDAAYMHVLHNSGRSPLHTLDLEDYTLIAIMDLEMTRRYVYFQT